MKLKTKLAAIALALAATGASAGSVTYSNATAQSLTDWAGVTLAVHQFDASLGTLTGIKFQLDISGLNNISVTNNSSAYTWSSDSTAHDAGSVDPDTGDLIGSALGVKTTGKALGSGALAATTLISTTEWNYFTGLNGTTIDAGATQSTGDFALTGTNTKTWNASTTGYAAVFAALTGAGNYDLITSARGISANVTPGNFDISTVSYAMDTVYVTYYYSEATPTPEPGSIALAGLGLVGLVASRRRRRS